jgi:hypothetical protein
LKTSKMTETPYFFNIIVPETVFKFAAPTEESLAKWLISFKTLSVRLCFVLT